MVSIVNVRNQAKAEIVDFFDEVPEEEWELDYGYFLELEGERIGYFVLYPLEDGACWLRKLMMRQGIKPAAYVMAFEWALELAKEHEYQTVFVQAKRDESVPLLQMHRFLETEAPVASEESAAWYVRELS